jgi:outer membrane protein OmpA-like peptidoglycan-associated protein
MTGRPIVAIVLSLGTTIVAAQPAKQGHPMIPPYPGSTEGQGVNVVAFNEYDIPIGPSKDGKWPRTQHVEGKFTNFGYGKPPGRSTLEVLRNYEGALKAAGFQTLFSCRMEACGGQTGLQPLGFVPYDDGGYVAAKLARAEGDVYVAMNVMPNETRFVVIETKPMETGLVKISADALSKDIGSVGHVAVYDILFDTGSAAIKAESAPALAEIARLLSRDPKLALHVVGHTDNVGGLAQNLDLSKRRAEAVVAALTTTHKIAAARLRADGVGPLAPVAGNDTDAGRAKNRRVELVKQ